MIASLPMYARRENRAAHDRFWVRIRDNLRQHGMSAPEALDHTLDPKSVWDRPDLTLSHICNLPYRLYYKDRVTVIGAADYGLDGCAPGYYRSVFVARKTDPRSHPTEFAGGDFAYNETTSQSGYGAAQLWAHQRGFQFRPTHRTGSHHASVIAVADGDADIAAIDAQTWRMERQTGGAAQQLRVVGHTDHSPGMSFITRNDQPTAPYFDAIRTAIQTLPQRDRNILGLQGIVALPDSAYDLPFAPKTQANAG